MPAFTRDEDYEMWKFLLKEAPSPETGVIERDRLFARGLTIWGKFKAEVNSIRTVSSLRKRFSMRTFPTPFELDFTHEDRVKLFYAFQLPVDHQYIPILFKNADVKLDDERKIREYKERREGGLHLHLQASRASQKRKATEPPTTSKRDRVEQEEEIPDEDFYDDDVYLEEHVEYPNEPMNWMMTESIKPEPVEMRVPVVSVASSDDFSTHEPEQTPNAELNPMQDFLVSLKDAIVSSHSTMLSAVRELVPPKTESQTTPKLKKKKKKKHFELESRPLPTSQSNVPKKEYLQNLSDLLSNYNHSDLDEVKQKLEDAVRNSDEEQLEVKRIKLMMETTLAMMGF